MDCKQKLLDELKDHFPEVLYGVEVHLWNSNDVINILNYEKISIANNTTAFELCRFTIVRDVVKVSDDIPTYKRYHFVVRDCTEDSVTASRFVS